MPALDLSRTMWDLVPWPRVEPRPLSLGEWSLSRWTTRGVLGLLLLFGECGRDGVCIPFIQIWNLRLTRRASNSEAGCCPPTRAVGWRRVILKEAHRKGQSTGGWTAKRWCGGSLWTEPSSPRHRAGTILSQTPALTCSRCLRDSLLRWVIFGALGLGGQRVDKAILGTSWRSWRGKGRWFSDSNVVPVCQPLPEVLGRALAAPPSSNLALAKLPFHLSYGVRSWEQAVSWILESKKTALSWEEPLGVSSPSQAGTEAPLPQGYLSCQDSMVPLASAEEAQGGNILSLKPTELKPSPMCWVGA